MDHKQETTTAGLSLQTGRPARESATLWRLVVQSASCCMLIVLALPVLRPIVLSENIWDSREVQPCWSI